MTSEHGDARAPRPDFAAIAAAGLKSLPALLARWLPDGKREGSEWVARNPTRADRKPRSFTINLITGVWADFATGDKGGDAISLLAYIEGISQSDAARALVRELGLEQPVSRPNGEDRNCKSTIDREVHESRASQWHVILPVPADAPEPPRAHVKRGKPEMQFSYRDSNGALLGYACRFVTSEGGKEVLPLVFAEHAYTKARKWRWLSFAKPRPLYGLPNLAAKPEARVLVVEGEKCADAAHALLETLACVSWPGGTNAVAKADWRALRGRDVIIWPDCDAQRVRLTREEQAAGVDPASKPLLPLRAQPGIAAADQIAQILLGLDCAVCIVNVPEPLTVKPGWDIADSIAEGWDAAACYEFIATNARDVQRALAETIVIRGGERHKVIRAAAATLAKRDHVYQRNNSIVEVIRNAEIMRSAREKELLRRDPEALLLRGLGVDRAMTLLTEHGHWARERRDGFHAIDFPKGHALGLLADGEWHEIRALAGIIGAPTLRADGSLLMERGYDPRTGLLFVSATEFPPIPNEPSKDQASEALKVLQAPFVDFPWVTPAAESAHLATILATLVRRMLPTAPGTAYTAPVAGSGKGLLACSVGEIGHGIKPTAMPYAKARDELRKLLCAVLLDGDPILLLDNIVRPLDSAELCILLTTDRYGDRVLTRSQTAKFDARVMVLATGNNLTLVGDLTRRFLRPEIDPKTERPETRSQFAIRDLRAHLRAQRGVLATAVLTILRAFYVANPEEQATPIGSFEVWSRWVREPLLWLGQADPCDTMTQARDEDPDRERLGHLITAWFEEFASAPQMTTDVLEVANRSAGGSYLHPSLRSALVAALGGERELDAGRLGCYLRKYQGRIVDGFRIERDERRWRISPVSGCT